MTDNQAKILQSMRKSVNAYENAAKKMKQRAEAIARIFQDIHNNELAYEKSVAHIVEKAGVSVTLLSFFNRSQSQGCLAQNMFFMCRMIFEEGSEYLEYDDGPLHSCQNDCKHQDDFYYLILSNYKATPAISKLVQQWKEVGDHDGSDTRQHDRFCEIFTALEKELAKDKFKIKTNFIDLV